MITHTSRAFFVSRTRCCWRNLRQSIRCHKQMSLIFDLRMLLLRSRTIADTLGEMARLMPDYVATEIPTIRTQCHCNQSRNQKKVFFLDTTARDRCAATFGRRVLRVASAKAWSDG